MTAEPVEPTPMDDHALITKGGEVSAVVVPIGEYRRLRALARNATREELELAEMDAAHEAYLEWEAAGSLGVISHEEAMAELFGDAR